MARGPAKVSPFRLGQTHGLLAILMLAVAVRALLLSLEVFPFNADEAVVGLMARHVLRGSLPTFFYGQAYLGSLDPLLVAGAFAALGESVASIRAVQVLLYLGTLVTSVILARRLGFGPGVGALVGLLLAVPPVVVTLYTTVSLGGYGEALLLGNLLLLGALTLLDRDYPPIAWLGWGALAGFAFWVFALTIVVSLPCALVLGIRLVRESSLRSSMARLASGVIGGILGAAPLVLWSIRNGFTPAVREVLGSAISGASPANLLASVGSHAVNLALFGPTVTLGLRPPWSPELLGRPLTPIAALVWVVLIGFGLRASSWARAHKDGRPLLSGVAVTLAAGFLLTPFGADPSGRYFLPLAVPLAIVAAVGAAELAARVSFRWAAAAVGSLLVFQAGAHLEAARLPSGFTTQFDATTVFDRSQDRQLISFLIREGEAAGYTTYWVAYPLAFLSQEELVYVPHLPYHADFRYTSRDDRYPPYTGRVAAAGKVAYLTAGQPWLDNYLSHEFGRLGVAYRVTTIGEYRVFHSLDRAVRPSEIGLGPQAAP